MKSPADYISARAHDVDASGIRKVFDLAAKMKDPINLSIGLPDFDVPEPVKLAAIDSIAADLTISGTSKSGSPIERLIGSFIFAARSNTLRMPEASTAWARREM